MKSTVMEEILKDKWCEHPAGFSAQDGDACFWHEVPLKKDGFQCHVGCFDDDDDNDDCISMMILMTILMMILMTMMKMMKMMAILMKWLYWCWWW